MSFFKKIYLSNKKDIYLKDQKKKDIYLKGDYHDRYNITRQINRIGFS